MRLGSQFEQAAAFIPDARAVAGGGAEAVVSRRQVGVIGHPPRAGLYPILVQTLQTVLEGDILRHGEAWRREIKRHALVFGRHFETTGGMAKVEEDRKSTRLKSSH